MVRASASGAIDSGLIPSRVKPMTLKLVIIASLPDAQHKRDSVKNKPASLLVSNLQNFENTKFCKFENILQQHYDVIIVYCEVSKVANCATDTETKNSLIITIKIPVISFVEFTNDLVTLSN